VAPPNLPPQIVAEPVPSPQALEAWSAKVRAARLFSREPVAETAEDFPESRNPEVEYRGIFGERSGARSVSVEALACRGNFSPSFWGNFLAERLFGKESSVVANVTSNNALERTVRHGGPRLAAASASWPAAQLGR
jgi:hypothetical protein